MKKILFLLTCVVMLLSFVQPTLACSIGVSPPTKTPWIEEFDLATMVFVGEFQGSKRIEIMAPPTPGTFTNMYAYDVEATFKVTKAYKEVWGYKGELIKVTTMIGGPCEFLGVKEWEKEKPGTPWLIYANMSLLDSSKNEWRLRNATMSLTSRLANAQKENLTFLDKWLADLLKRVPTLKH